VRQYLKVLLIGWLLPWPLLAGESPRTQLEVYLADTTTLEASFVQTLTDEDGNILEIAEGSLYLHRPGRFRWEYRKPYEQSIIADGSVLWIYDPDLEQVTRRPLDGALSYTPAALLGNEMDLNENFLISEEGEANGLSWLLLTSRSVNDEHYNAFRLAFDEAGLRAMEMSDNFGQRTLLQFTDEHRNEKLDPSIFRFEPPLGVDVFDAASGR